MGSGWPAGERAIPVPAYPDNHLFKLTEDKAFAEEPFVSTIYEDKTYYLEEPPDGMESRAGSVLALVSQLFGLHKRSEELPTTTTIKTVGDGS